jgi:hypothetical protein
MRRPSSYLPPRASRFAVFAAIVAIVVAVTGFEASTHGHLPAADGWHDTKPHGASAREEGLNSCSICRLAHETSSVPVAPGTVSEPLRMIAPPDSNRNAPALVILTREHSPRAPPGLAYC